MTADMFVWFVGGACLGFFVRMLTPDWPLRRSIVAGLLLFVGVLMLIRVHL